MGARVIASDWHPPPRQRLVDCLGRPATKGWIAQMVEPSWYGNPEVSGSSPGPVRVFLAIFRSCSKVPHQFFLDLKLINELTYEKVKTKLTGNLF